MLTTTLRIPEDRRLYLLADHLDAVLATGEDLKRIYHDCANAKYPNAKYPNHDPNSLSLTAFVARVRKLEFAAMGRIKLSRIYAGQLSRRDDSLGSLARLFAGATKVVVDSIDEVCDSEYHAFRHGFDPLVYLRGRGLVSEDAGCLNVIDRISIDDGFLLAERIELGVLLNMCAQFLDFMDVHFDLFQDAPPPVAALPAPAVPSILQIHRSGFKAVAWQAVSGLPIAAMRGVRD